MNITKRTVVELQLTSHESVMVTLNKRSVTILEIVWDVSLDVVEAHGMWMGIATQEYVSLDKMPPHIIKILKEAADQ